MVELKADSPEKSLNEIDKPRLVTVFASVFTIGVGERRPHGPSAITNVSRQSPNSCRRQRTTQGPGRVQASARREVRAPILHHQPRREGCTSLSLRGVGADRAEIGRTLHFQSYKEEVSGSYQLLGSAGGDRRT